MLRKLFSIILAFLLCAVFTQEVVAQKVLPGGNINQYAKVLSIDAGDKVTVNDASGFFPGDTVLIIQMKGVQVSLPSGNGQNQFSAGRYEFIIVIGVTGNQITFVTNLTNPYDPGGNVQIVRVPGYNNAVVNGILTCQPWDSVSGTGGILSLIVGGTLTLNADIDVSGSGFKGGLPVTGTGECASVDISYENSTYTASSDSSGFKGEGIASYYTLVKDPLGHNYDKGYGQLFNGGGGGNANMSGGGGGGNIGAGGKGGDEIASCGPPKPVGGNGGSKIEPILTWRDSNLVVLGGGGGSGTQFGGTIATAGGKGGGLVILMLDTLVGNNYTIRANGESVTAFATGGGGGGGAGGSILLGVSDYVSALNTEVLGGNGGATNGPTCTGAGGGGGGGLVWYSNSSSSGNLNALVSKGGLGIASCGSQFGGTGEDGILEPVLKLPLTGFLFNTIFLADTAIQIDTICEGDVAPLFVGTTPKGGVPPYTYTWQSSTDKISWGPAIGSGLINFNPSAPLLDTTYYRRIIQDAPGVDQITDISKEITIIVQPKIIHDNIVYNDSACSGVIPDTIFSNPPLPSGGNGPGSYFYVWQEKSAATGNLWVDAQGINNLSYYIPPVRLVGAITEVQFRRIVSSGIGCPDTITLGILNYLPPLVNFISADQEICDEDTPQLLVTNAANPVSGGSGSYVYQWFESTDNITYNQVVATNATYQPSALIHGTALTRNWYYKRKITSGVCQDTSAPVAITVYPLISGNIIGRDSTICKGTSPNPLTGATYSGGAGFGTYSFQWLSSSDNVNYNMIPGGTVETLNTGDLLASSYFKRIIISDFAPNSCRDTSTTPVLINIHPIFNANIADLSTGQDTVCNGSPGKVTLTMDVNPPWNVWVSNDQGWSGSYVGLNTIPVDIDVNTNFNFTGNTPLANLVYQIDSIKDTYGCTAEVISGTGKVVSVRAPVADAGISIDFCGLNTSLDASLNYGSGIWSGPPGVNFTDPTNPKTGVSSTEGTYNLNWTAYGEILGVCPDDVDQTTLVLWSPPSPAIIIPGNDTLLEAFANTIQLRADFPVPRVGTILWELKEGSGTFDDDTSQNVLVNNLDWGDNIIQLNLRNGSCADETNTITVTVLETPDIPSGISPRVSPNQNDFFRVKNVENVPNDLSIFTRMGNIVFHTKNFMTAGNFPNGWDGTDKNGKPLPDDTYYYVLKVEGLHPKIFSGFIVIRGSK